MKKFKLKKYEYNIRIVGSLVCLLSTVGFYYDLCNSDLDKYARNNLYIYEWTIICEIIFLAIFVSMKILHYIFHKLAKSRGKEYEGVIDKAVARGRIYEYVYFKIVYKDNGEYKFKRTGKYYQGEYGKKIAHWYDKNRYRCKLHKYKGMMFLDEKSIEEDEHWNFYKNGWGL